MASNHHDSLSALLEQVGAGQPGARDRLVDAVYSELRKMAAGLMSGERPGHTLQPSALVNEAIVRLLEGDALTDLPNRRYLFAAAARAMHQVLIDHARRRNATKRFGARIRMPLDATLEAFGEQGLDVIALHEALGRLEREYPRQAEVVSLRFFAGMAIPEVAEAMEISRSTVESDWRFARAWLRGCLGEGDWE